MTGNLSSPTVFRRGPLAELTDKATEEHVLDIRHWTEKLFSFRMTRPAAFRFQPGQFARLGIPSEKFGIIWRAYSIVSASYDEYLEFFSIIVPNGAFTTRLAKLVSGDTIHLEKLPYGYLTTGRFVGGRDLWLLASGTGVAPFLSILRDPEIWERFDNLILAYSVREAKDLAYREEILALTQAELYAPQAHKFRFAPIVTREHISGMLEQRLTALIKNKELERFVSLPIDPDRARILVCGNPQMLDEMRGVLTERGLRPDRSRNPGNFAFENYW